MSGVREGMEQCSENNINEIKLVVIDRKAKRDKTHKNLGSTSSHKRQPEIRYYVIINIETRSYIGLYCK